MRRYKIGQVSKMLDAPVETIRFLEQKGLLSPEKDEDSGYRYYDIWDVNRILDYQKYRQTGFSSNEAVSLVKNGDLDSLTARLAEKENEARFLSRFYEAKALKLKNYQIVLKNAMDMIGRYLILNCPENYSLFLRSIDADGLHVSSAKAMEGSYEELTQYYPFTEHIYRIKREWLESPEHSQDAQWGLTMKKQWVDELNIRLLPSMERMKSTTALFTVIPVGEREFFSAELLTEALAFMRSAGYELNGDILGIYLATVREQGQAVRYMEVWIPVRTEEHAPDCTEDFHELRSVFE